jgi:hypothetical protein
VRPPSDWRQRTSCQWDIAPKKFGRQMHRSTRVLFHGFYDLNPVLPDFRQSFLIIRISRYCHLRITQKTKNARFHSARPSDHYCESVTVSVSFSHHYPSCVHIDPRNNTFADYELPPSLGKIPLHCILREGQRPQIRTPDARLLADGSSLRRPIFRCLAMGNPQRIEIQ